MTPDVEGHRHRWAGIELFLRDGHPFVAQTCPCGSRRELQAFERFWQPGPDGSAVPRRDEASAR